MPLVTLFSSFFEQGTLRFLCAWAPHIMQSALKTTLSSLPNDTTLSGGQNLTKMLPIHTVHLLPGFPQNTVETQ